MDDYLPFEPQNFDVADFVGRMEQNYYEPESEADDE